MLVFNLRIQMAIHKMNISELSELTGIRRQTISNYYNETYKHIVKEHLEAFIRVFKCDITDLLEWKED
ncbi:helix-turn-helix transcriptional regulator [Clostridium botulinum]|uniref:helix-turn-helix domain-containing protein n=1 Tax=unclassified Clostridium TaxID=2614128 RepID=UPI0013CA5386|nr:MULTISPECIES: helix-turn-helix transcriptional regulator [unclassified Clostridium]NFH99491.1 helix-turn-helix transcriptional regulator [Clostridium botulinum]NFI62174.1 helix-turn-helix transcriptional regulator [Clostridium botulinum]NFJ42620.1 helix-turn-helix transcriptional regulator [Clostridium botulinum]NFJ46509.1 helix-turn-helix transcriptional regulator [Clostridium botulinum]NFK26449.1 helix-turn-helix transcriptional regulator [Clostridium botulinum]